MTGPVLGIETTCDETSAAVLDADGRIAGLVIHSQDVHEVYGGVVPELAARDHLRRIEPVAEAALRQANADRRDLRAIAVAAGPGLIGALLVGVTWSRATAFALGTPLVPVHHMEGHLFGPVLEDPDAVPPFVALLVSGGHTLLTWAPEWGRYFLMGQTRDDAAGEAFDKVAKLLGLSYPGGPAIEAAAALGDPLRYAFPRPLASSSGKPGDPGRFDFSFSGLKTAVVRAVDGARLAGERARLAGERAHGPANVLTWPLPSRRPRWTSWPARPSTPQRPSAVGASSSGAASRPTSPSRPASWTASVPAAESSPPRPACRWTTRP